jgi:hypothetical protein
MHAYRQTVGTIKKANQSGAFSAPSLRKEGVKESSKDLLPGGLHISTPDHITIDQPAPMISPPPSPPIIFQPPPKRATGTSALDHQPQQNYVHPALHLLTTLLTPPSSPTSPPRATPLATAHILTLLLTPFTSILSRLLPYLLYTHLFSPTSLVSHLQSARNALFPGGYPSVPPPDPTPDEQAELRQTLARRLLTLVPAPLQLVLGTTADMRLETIDGGLLEPLSSAECNAHLMLFVLDLVLLAVFPEMGVSMGDALDGVRTPMGSMDSELTDMTPPRPDSRPP